MQEFISKSKSNRLNSKFSPNLHLAAQRLHIRSDWAMMHCLLLLSRGTLQACLVLWEVTGPSPISVLHVRNLVICAFRLNFELLVPAHLHPSLSSRNHYCPWQYYHGLQWFRQKYFLRFFYNFFFILYVLLCFIFIVSNLASPM
jgi:hypothetical protein